MCIRDSVDVAPLADRGEALRALGQTVMFVAVDRKLMGLIGVADPIKSTTPDAIAALKRDGLRLVMLTGDNATTAKAVAKQLGLEEVIADVKPCLLYTSPSPRDRTSTRMPSSA